MNVDPFEKLEGGFFATDWDFKVRDFVAPQRLCSLMSHVLHVLSLKSCDNSSNYNYLILLISRLL